MKKRNNQTIIFNLFSLVFLLVIFPTVMAKLFAQNNWLNFTNSQEVRDIVFQDNFAWIATSGGLMKLDLITEEGYLINRSNSGIPSNNISSLCIDSSNNIWVGTYDAGVAKFDGINWECYSEDFDRLKSNRILSLFTDSKGTVWIGTGWDLYRFYDGYLLNDWNIQGIIQDITEDKNGAIWIGTTGELLRISDGKLKFWGQVNKPIPFFNVSNLAVGNDNKIWILAKEGIITYADSQFNKFNLNSIDFPNSLISSITVDNQNNLWLASPYGRIAKYNGINVEIFDSKNSELMGGRINKIKVDKSGNVWACSGNGLYKYENSRWNFISTKTSILTLKQSTNLFSDRKNNIWLVDGSDLYFFSRDTIIHYDKSNSKFKGAYSIAFDNSENVWIGNSGGLTMFDGNNWYEIDTLQSILLNREQEFFNKYKDTAWVEKNYKRYLIDSTYFFPPQYYISKLTFDNFDNLWLKSSDVLVKYDGKNWALYDTTNSKIPVSGISDLDFDSKNNMWIGTYTNGLIKYDGEKYLIYDSTNSIIANRVNSLNIFNDSLFISTTKGTALFYGEIWNEIFMGVSTNTTIKDENGNYWIASSVGLINPNRDGYGKYYGTMSSGIANNYIQKICFDFSENLWILSNGGINIFNEEEIKNEEKIVNFLTSF